MLVPLTLLLPLPGWLQMSTVPKTAARPNCAGMPAIRADTNRPNQIVRNPPTDGMKHPALSNLPQIATGSKQKPNYLILLILVLFLCAFQSIF